MEKYLQQQKGKTTELTSRKRKRDRTCPLTWPIRTLIS